ncbi:MULTISPECIES: hypothetical protein [Fusobacterium]|uniref:hypothetical protein n=1 Tax=Fusobacterium TaxID=848 RepID=UPI001F4F8F1F|nr:MULTISPECIES: hypothetical protein [Fusobacterium]MDD7391302.1 hypothetical protein [Fusobacteriaceae bacterium]MCI5725012.1 hypothetical protein [Fusobacterium sp.]MCI7223647.1 hypothetical protein [Fusobacterium sp.]MDY5306711.1 hypothetical protein [Fusobacterium gastrosuis]MDY5795007.1 hypothetical protein [Fusobacterium gastrosuis]
MEKLERLNNKEIKEIIDKLKENKKYEEFKEMLFDDFEEHKIVYKVSDDEIIALAYKNNTIPFKMKEYYDWQQITYLMEEDAGFPQ